MAGSIALRGGQVWDGRAEQAVEATVVFDADGVSAVGPDAAAARTIDVSGCTVLPGLIEAHAHLCFNARPDWRAVYDADSPGRRLLRMAANARAMLEAGITTVRDLGAPTEAAIEIREAVAGGLALGPDLLVSGAPITTTGGHCYFMGGEADGELALRVAVRERVRAGVDWIKVMATGGAMTPGTNVARAQYSLDELRVIVEEAQRLGRPVAAHCHGREGIRFAVAAGIDTLEHCSFRGPDGIEQDEALVRAIAGSAAVVSPTISVLHRATAGSDRFTGRSLLLQRLLAAGARLIMSTDCGIPGAPHAALAQGMQMLHEMAGLSRLETLKAATSGAAAALGLTDRGEIRAGRRADLLIVAGDPLAGLAALEQVRFVVRNGVVLGDAP